MKTQNVNFIKTLIVSFITLGLLAFQSCSNSDFIEDEENTLPEIQTEELQSFNASDLQEMKEVLKSSGVNLDGLDIYAGQPETAEGSNQNKAPSVASILVKAIKVSTTTNHPDGSGTKIPISGVLLVPRLNLFSLRLVVSPVPTYTNNEDAPSNLFKSLTPSGDMGDLDLLYFWIVQATQGFAVLFPDYPGFGDSYQKAFIPYLTKTPMVNSTIDLIKASQETLKKNRYSYKSDLILTGYSLGAYVATAIAKELDSSTQLPVKLTIAGGNPADVKDIVIRTSKETTLTSSIVFPYTLLSYIKNEKADFLLQDLLKPPYDLNYLEEQFNGTHRISYIGNNFSKTVSKLFTDDAVVNFETGAKYATLRNLMSKNSIEPWKNKKKLILIHGTSDDLVYYASTRNFYEEQKKLGGNIQFTPIIAGDHITTIVAYYLETSILLLANK
jgi:pimeloyl-ACP methyl ester carboxylesterase